MAIAVTRQEQGAAALRQLARRAEDPRQACRLLAIALVLEGSPRTDAARSCGMDRQTLRDWVHRYNEDGIAGLRDRACPEEAEFCASFNTPAPPQGRAGCPGGA